MRTEWELAGSALREPQSRGLKTPGNRGKRPTDGKCASGALAEPCNQLPGSMFPQSRGLKTPGRKNKRPTDDKCASGALASEGRSGEAA